MVAILTATGQQTRYAPRLMLIPMVMLLLLAAGPTATILIGLSTQGDTRHRGVAQEHPGFVKLQAAIPLA